VNLISPVAAGFSKARDARPASISSLSAGGSGTAKASVTLDVYGHLMEGAAAAKAIEGLLK